MIQSAVADQFTYNVQLAGYDYDRYDEKGVIDYDGFVRAFDQFPWREQMEEWQRIGQGCSATIAVTDHSRGVDYWVSIGTRDDKPMFLLGVVYEKEVKGFLGFGKPKKKQSGLRFTSRLHARALSRHSSSSSLARSMSLCAR